MEEEDVLKLLIDDNANDDFDIDEDLEKKLLQEEDHESKHKSDKFDIDDQFVSDDNEIKDDDKKNSSESYDSNGKNYKDNRQNFHKRKFNDSNNRGDWNQKSRRHDRLPDRHFQPERNPLLPTVNQRQQFPILNSFTPNSSFVPFQPTNSVNNYMNYANQRHTLLQSTYPAIIQNNFPQNYIPPMNFKPPLLSYPMNQFSNYPGVLNQNGSQFHNFNKIPEPQLANSMQYNSFMKKQLQLQQNMVSAMNSNYLLQNTSQDIHLSNMSNPVTPNFNLRQQNYIQPRNNIPTVQTQMNKNYIAAHNVRGIQRTQQNSPMTSQNNMVHGRSNNVQINTQNASSVLNFMNPKKLHNNGIKLQANKGHMKKFEPQQQTIKQNDAEINKIKEDFGIDDEYMQKMNRVKSLRNELQKIKAQKRKVASAVLNHELLEPAANSSPTANCNPVLTTSVKQPVKLVPISNYWNTQTPSIYKSSMPSLQITKNPIKTVSLPPEDPPSPRVRINGLDSNVRESSVRKFCRPYGMVKQIAFVTEPNGHRYAIVHFEQLQEAHDFMKNCQNQEIDCCQISITYSNWFVLHFLLFTLF